MKEETNSKRCSYGGDDHPCDAKYPACANCDADAGCTRCRDQRIRIKCKQCGVVRNLFPWYRERMKPIRESNPLAVAGTTRFTPSGFPMIVEGDGWLRAVRIDKLPLRRRVTVDVRGAYLDGNGEVLHPEEWTDAD